MGQKIGLLTVGLVLIALGLLLLFLRADWILAADEGMTEQEKREKHEEIQKFIRMTAWGFIFIGTLSLILFLSC